MSRVTGSEAALDRVKSREELQKELAELWAASKQQTPSLGNSQHRDFQPVQHQLQQQPLLQEALAGLDSARKSNDKRKFSSERKPSSDLSGSGQHKGDKGSDAAGGSQDSGAGPWGVQESHACDQDNSSVCGGDNVPCLKWLPYKAVAATIRRHPAIAIIPMLLFLALATAGVLGVYFVAANETRLRRLSAEGFAINAAVAFERQLAQMFFPLLSLATIVRNNPSYERFNASFDSVAQELMSEMPTQGAVTNLIAAPQGVLRNFYPLSGYCQDKCDDININLFKNEERREVALRTVKEGKLVMQGPMMLSQGYFGVVGRKPIYIANSSPNETFGAPDGLAYNCSVCWNATTKTQFWGFVNAVINLQSLTNGNDSRLRDLRVMGYRYEMYKYEKNGSRTEIARSHVLPTDPVFTDVHVPGGDWFLEVSPDNGWVPIWRAPMLAVVVLVCSLFALLLGAILVSNRLQSWLKVANDALAREKERMDVLLARQHNLISCVLEGDISGGGNGKHGSAQHRTLARIEDMRREIGVAHHTNGTTNGADELQLSELIDEGTYGKVFKGLWRGSIVAVKTMVLPAKMSGAEKRERMAVMEAAISSTMQHPNIVQTFTYVVKPCSTSVAQQRTSDDGSYSQGSPDHLPTGSLANLESCAPTPAAVHNFEVSLVLEYCDWGSVRTALDAGAFFADDNSLNYAAILDTAADIARAMLHLHKNQVLHSDLKVRNVLLKSDASGRGCVAKVADFGLAVRMDCMDTHISAFQGTMSHMAPEALLHGHISKAADVYAYGITLWELFTGGQAYQGIPRALVGHKVAVLGLRPTLPPFTPADFRTLVEDCWHQDPDKRPAFECVLARLVRMRTELGIPNTPPLQRYQLRPKSLDTRNSSEKGVDGAAADAQAQGLIHLGSFYVNDSTTSTAPQADAPHSFNSGDKQSPVSSGSGSGDGSFRQLCANSGSNGGSGGSNGHAAGRGGYRAAPRTQYMASRLYAMPASTLSCIPDTEDLVNTDEESSETGQGNQLPPTPPGQQQQQQEQQSLPQLPPKQQQQQQGMGNGPCSLQASSKGHQGSNGLSNSSSSKGVDAAAGDDCWLVELPPGELQVPEEEVPADGTSSGQQQQQRSRSGSGGCRQSCDLQRAHPGVQPDVEQGRC